MEQAGLSAFEKHGLTGVVVFFLFFALYKLHDSDTSKDSVFSKQHGDERKMWHEERLLWLQQIKELTVVIAELHAKLPTFCGERRYKKPDHFDS